MLMDHYSKRLYKLPILVVDDEPVNLKLVERILKKEGFRHITCINSAREVEKAYHNERPYLILLDVNMPELNGFEVLERLKTLFGNELPPVVFLTGRMENNLRTRAFESGALDYISKPFNRLELLSRVKNLLALENAHETLVKHNDHLASTVQKRTLELRQTQLQVVEKLGRAAEFRDNETGAHLLRMSNISALIARHHGYTEMEIQDLLFASPLHDVGKIAIPDHILLKPGPFESQEWEIMQTHTTLGYEILKAQGSGLLKLAAEIALHHHEKWDGSGYPHGLSGKDIPVSCRIVAVADVFDALSSKRPYKEAWPIAKARKFINEQSGKHFDPEIVKVFNRVFPQILEIRERYQDDHESSDHHGQAKESGFQALSSHLSMLSQAS